MINTVLAAFLGLGVLLIPLLGIRVNLEAVLFGDLLAASPQDLQRSLLALLALALLLLWRYRDYVYLGVDPLGAASAGLPVMRDRSRSLNRTPVTPNVPAPPHRAVSESTSIMPASASAKPICCRRSPGPGIPIPSARCCI